MDYDIGLVTTQYCLKSTGLSTDPSEDEAEIGSRGFLMTLQRLGRKRHKYTLRQDSH